jgi:anaerobic magnesium-protoporphyrin IX monomethyl ester cyclase
MKNRGLLFIVPPSLPIDDLTVTDNDHKGFGYITSSIPMGVLSLSSYVRKHTKTNVTIIDMNTHIRDEMKITDKWEDFFKKVLIEKTKDKKIDLVGISAIFNVCAGYMKSITTISKEVCNNPLVIAGGGLPSNLPEEVYEIAPEIDAIAYSEGEKPLVRLLNSEDMIADLEQSNGWITKKSLEEKKKRPTMEFVDSLDEIPPMSYDLIDFTKYKNLTRYHGEVTAKTITTSLMTSRGCPYMCNFCASHTVHSRKMRFESPERVLETVKHLKSEHGVNVFCIEDDLFLVHRKRALKIFEALAKEDITIEFPNGMSVHHMNDDIMIDALKAAGLKMATLAVESGVERVLKDVIRKPYADLNIVRELVERLRRKELYSRAFFVIGFPGETLDEIKETINFMKTTGFNWVIAAIASPIAGSELYDECKNKGLIINDDLSSYSYGKSNIRLPYATAEEMEKIRYEAVLEVNFVNNYDLNHGMPKQALIGFKGATDRIKNHALGHYYSSIAYSDLGQHDKATESLKLYNEIIKDSDYWRQIAKRYKLPLNNLNTNIGKIKETDKRFQSDGIVI